jgi:hypothetical protein
VSTIPSGWLPLILTTLGGGVIGSLITTYGTQTRDRRAARADVRTRLVHAENLARLPEPPHAQLTAAIEAVENAALIAKVPRYIVTLYRDTRTLAYATRLSTPPDQRRQEDSPNVVSGRVAHQATILLATTLWHPWLSALIRWHRARQLRRVLTGGMPTRANFQRDTRHNLRKWEHEMIRRNRKPSGYQPKETQHTVEVNPEESQ